MLSRTFPSKVSFALIGLSLCLSSASVQAFVSGCCESNQDPVKFKVVLKDWLIIIRAIEPDEDAAREEQEAAKALKQQEESAKAVAVPGLLKPAEKEDDEV